MSRRAVVALAVVLLLAAIPAGRWERSRSISARNAGIDRVVAAVGGRLYTSGLSGYRLAEPLDCLSYADGPMTFRWELCYQTDGRLIEAIDRLHEPARIWSFRDEPAAARTTVPPRKLYAVFRRLGAFRDQPFDGAVPTGLERPIPTLRPMLQIALAVGPHLGSHLLAWRATADRICLEHGRKEYELCFDRHGNLVSATNRKLGVREECDAADSPLRASVPRLRAILIRVGALPPSTPRAATLPLDSIRTGR